MPIAVTVGFALTVFALAAFATCLATVIRQQDRHEHRLTARNGLLHWACAPQPRRPLTAATEAVTEPIPVVRPTPYPRDEPPPTEPIAQVIATEWREINIGGEVRRFEVPRRERNRT
jgi:hypothetical protein